MSKGLLFCLTFDFSVSLYFIYLILNYQLLFIFKFIVLKTTLLLLQIVIFTMSIATVLYLIRHSLFTFALRISRSTIG